jgi:hypothetical protein
MEAVRTISCASEFAFTRWHTDIDVRHSRLPPTDLHLPVALARLQATQPQRQIPRTPEIAHHPATIFGVPGHRTLTYCSI